MPVGKLSPCVRTVPTGKLKLHELRIACGIRGRRSGCEQLGDQATTQP